MTQNTISKESVQQLTEELQKARLQVQQLEATQKARNSEQERFAYIVSHDLKSPLASIVLTIEMLRENLSETPDPGNEQLLNVLNRAATKIKNLADGLLTYYRADRAMDEPWENLELRPLAESVAATFKAGSSVSFQHPGDPVIMYTNGSALEQILAGLFHNAIRFGDKPQTNITLGFQEDPDFYYLDVADNGRGIAREDQEKIFSLFTSLGEDNSGVAGLGIGLFNVKKLVENLGGVIHLQSLPGEGSIFTFSIRKRLAPERIPAGIS